MSPRGSYRSEPARPTPPLRLIPDRWETSRLIASDGRVEELPELEEIYEACAYIKPWTGLASTAENPLRSVLAGEDLPPGGSKKYSRLQSIRLKETRRMVGFLEIYHGYPAVEVFWLGLLVVSPEFQKSGYGREAIEGLKEILTNLGGYTSIRLGVALKNWPAIRFWVRAGFDRIAAVTGDELHSDRTFAYLVLESRIAK
jgi:diamine N-acetyltransferase